MPSWFKILCAVDFSESSRVALQHAADLAQRFGAELLLVHVREGPRTPEAQITAPPELAEAEAEELRRKLDGWRAEAARLAQRPVKAVLEAGPPAAEIVRVAAAEKCDLVVTGTHARKGLRHLLLGSVAERVAREAPCPVLVARTPPEWGD